MTHPEIIEARGALRRRIGLLDERVDHLDAQAYRQSRKDSPSKWASDLTADTSARLATARAELATAQQELRALNTRAAKLFPLEEGVF